MVFHHDSLERKAARSGAFHFLVTNHRGGLSFESHSSFVTTRSQHLFSPQNSNNASTPHLTKSSSCARAFPTALMRYIFSETLLASCLNYCSCMAHAQSRSAESMTSLFNLGLRVLGCAAGNARRRARLSNTRQWMRLRFEPRLSVGRQRLHLRRSVQLRRYPMDAVCFPAYHLQEKEENREEQGEPPGQRQVPAIDHCKIEAVKDQATENTTGWRTQRGQLCRNPHRQSV